MTWLIVCVALVGYIALGLCVYQQLMKTLGFWVAMGELAKDLGCNLEIKEHKTSGEERDVIRAQARKFAHVLETARQIDNVNYILAQTSVWSRVISTTLLWPIGIFVFFKMKHGERCMRRDLPKQIIEKYYKPV